MKFTKLAAIFLCSVALLCGCAKKSDVVIKVNDSQITRGEFYDDFDKIKRLQTAQLPKEQRGEDSFALLLLKQKFVEDTISRTLLKEEFEAKKIEASEEEIEAKKNFLIQKVGSEKELKKILKENKISNDRFRQDLINEVKIDKLADIVISAKIGEKEAKAYYNANKEQFSSPETVHAYHILFGTNEGEIKRKIVDADKEGKLSNAQIDEQVKSELASKEKEAKELQAKLAKNPKDFEKIAKEKSDDKGSAERGGDLGYISRQTVVKEFGDQAFKQKVGTISPVVKSQFGYHIIYVTDKKAAGMEEFANVKDRLIDFLNQQAKIEAFNKYVADLKTKAKIEYIDENLKPENIQKQIQEAITKQLSAQEQPKTNEQDKK